MATQTQTSSSPAIWKRIVRVLLGEGPRGVVHRVQDRIHSHFAYHGGYLVACPITRNGELPPNPLAVQVTQISEKDPGILQELVQIYEPEYSEGMILTRWQQQRLLGFVGRVNGEAVGCVWVNPSGAVQEFNRPLFRLAADEVYYKDAMVKPAWRGKNIYPLIKAFSGQILLEQYGKKTALSFIQYSNKASLNASRKLGGQRIGYILLLKLFRRRFNFLIRTRARPM